MDVDVCVCVCVRLCMCVNVYRWDSIPVDHDTINAPNDTIRQGTRAELAGLKEARAALEAEVAGLKGCVFCFCLGIFVCVIFVCRLGSDAGADGPALPWPYRPKPPTRTHAHTRTNKPTAGS